MNILQGFTFCGVSSSSLDIYLDTPTRTMLPAVRTNEYIIPGRDGTLDYGGETYEKIQIVVSIAYKAGNTGLRNMARNLAMFFSGKGDLVFDDEPDKAYREAKVVDAPEISELINIGKSTIIFEAQPFAQSVTGSQIEALKQPLPYETQLEVKGTVRTPARIRIINSGNTTITQLTITRKAEI